MKSFRSEKGYTLLFVLVTLSVLSVLALATIGISLQSSRLTEIRESDIAINQDANNKLKEAIAELDSLTQEVDSVSLFNLISNPMKFQQKLGRNIKVIEQFQQNTVPTNQVLLLWNKQENSDVIKTLDLYIVSTIQKGDQPILRKTYSQRIYLSAIPNFLYYVLGSSAQVTLQGAPHISGNIYSKDPLKVTATPDFRYKEEIDETTIKGSPMYQNISAHPYIQGKIKIASSTSKLLDCRDFLECQNPTPSSVFRPSGNTQLMTMRDQFIDFDYLFALNDFLSLNSSIQFIDGDLKSVQTQLSEGLKQNNLIAYPVESFLDDFSQKRLIKPQSGTNTVTIATNILSNSSNNVPLIIDGNLNISSTGTSENPLIVSRPLIVNGDLLVQGNVEFSSTIFSVGDSILQDATIQKPTNSSNSLVLLSKGSVLINRVNSFKPKNSSSIDLEAFIYSDSTEVTKVFGVGSTLSLKGGIFTKGNLELNAYRGIFSKDDFIDREALIKAMIEGEKNDQSTSTSDDADRLQLVYDASVLKSAGLIPKNKLSQIFVESPKVIN